MNLHESYRNLQLHVKTNISVKLIMDFIRSTMEDAVSIAGDSSVAGGTNELLRYKFKITVNSHLRGNFREKNIDADDMAEFFTSVMKFKQEDMKYVNWSNKKISMRSFVCIMHLADPEIYDKSNYDLVTNGKGIEFGEIVNDKPRWIATFETTNERSGVAFIVQKPLSKGLTKE